MVKKRFAETEDGIEGEFDVKSYDTMSRKLRDRGVIETDRVIRSGINAGLSLEIGPGPGYLGLEWLKKTPNTRLRGLDMNLEMIIKAECNAREYGLQRRATYVLGDAHYMPFDDAMFDGVFTNGSLHEWARPEKIFNEVYRVLKPGGRYFIGDLRRDMNPVVRVLVTALVRPGKIRPGLVTSINAAYTIKEITSILESSKLENNRAEKTLAGMVVTGRKNG